MTRTTALHAALLQVQQHKVMWFPGTWGRSGWARLDGRDLDRPERDALNRVNLAGYVDIALAGRHYYSARAARLTSSGEQTLYQWARQVSA